MYSNTAKPLKTATAAVAALLAVTLIFMPGCGDASGPGSKPDPKDKDWRVSNWTKPDTSGYTTFNNGGIKIEMVLVKGGIFTMGCTMPEDELCYNPNVGYTERCDGGMLQNLCDENEYPAHKVTVSDFYIGQFEVTNKLWASVMGDYPKDYYYYYQNTGAPWDTIKESGYYIRDSDIYKNPLYPISTSTWSEIHDFLNKLNKLTNKNYRLPTEAEWEFAARGGNNSKNRAFAGSDNIEQVGRAKYYGDYLYPIGTKLPNELGIYDMSGNVSECVSDWFAPYTTKSQTNPQGPSSGTYHVNRGGNSNDNERDVRVSSRSISSTKGLRLALSAN